ncbi:hypothetical protein HanRHA438_Chr07g0298341 [Helianthus annuus]|nr:hypothetical protein HanRHA438_Chr07g0298341 [Helianthus annuus]
MFIFYPIESSSHPPFCENQVLINLGSDQEFSPKGFLLWGTRFDLHYVCRPSKPYAPMGRRFELGRFQTLVGL